MLDLELGCVSNPADMELCRAIQRGELAAVLMALANGADPNGLDSWGHSPLIYTAVRKGNPEIVRALLTAGANPNSSTEDGVSLNAAIECCHTDIAVLLVEAGAYVTWGNLDKAIVQENATLTNVLLNAFPDVNARDGVGATLLMSAAFVGNIDAVRLLLERGADVNAHTLTAWSALMSASAVGHAEIVQKLLDAGADVNARDKGGDTPLRLALTEEHQEIVALLMAVGAAIH